MTPTILEIDRYITILLFQIQAFRPFFVSLNLPYSVVRGEQLAMQANVFNYMSQDLDVSICSIYYLYRAHILSCFERHCKKLILVVVYALIE